MAGEGWSDAAIESRLSDLDERMAAAGRDLFTPQTVWACPGIPALLVQLGRREDVVPALLTGNIRDGAAAKLQFFDLWEHFHFGGYGDDHESRNDVAAQAVADAQRHLGDHFHDCEVWVIGDTVHDVECARSVGARCLAVATGGATIAELRGAGPDLLLNDLTWCEELRELIGDDA